MTAKARLQQARLALRRYADGRPYASKIEDKCRQLAEEWVLPTTERAQLRNLAQELIAQFE